MRLSLSLFSIFIIVSHLLSAVTISGTVEGFQGQYIRLYVVSDFISFKEIKSDVTKIGSDGSFELSTVSRGDLLIKLRIEDKSVSVICPSGSDLNLTLSYDEEFNRGRIFDKELRIEFLNNSDGGVNSLIWQYQRQYAEFLEKNQRLFVAKQGLQAVKKFQAEMLEKYKDEGSRYFADYLNYSLLAFEDAVLGSETKLYEKGLKNKRIIYNNLAYMSFFTQFFQQRFIQISQGKDGFEMLSSVNGTQDYSKLLKITASHKFINNDTLAELFIINGLREVFEEKTFKKKNILEMLKVIEAGAISRKNQIIAKNVYDELSFLKHGKAAPDFSLFDSENRVYHLSDFSQGPVLICFWSASSHSSLRQLPFLSEYHEKYGDRMTILGICIDDKTLKAKNHLKNNPVTWLNLYKDHQYDVTDKYRIYTVPVYVLINSKTEIVKYPASGPQDGLEAEINRLLSEK